MPVQERIRLRRAACEGNLPLIKRLMLKTNLQNPDPENGWTTLMYAARRGHTHVVEFLLKAGHEEHEISKDFENNTVLMIAAQYNYLEIMEIYINYFPDSVSMGNKKGQTAFILASQHNHLDAMKLLLKHGADINQTDYDGNTALHYAAAWDRFEAVTLLIDRGIQFAVKNYSGWTALDYSYSAKIESHVQDRARSHHEETKSIRRRNNLKVNVDSMIDIEMLTTRSATFPPRGEHETKSATYEYGNSLHSSESLSSDVSSPIRRKESLPW